MSPVFSLPGLSLGGGGGTGACGWQVFGDGPRQLVKMQWVPPPQSTYLDVLGLDWD